MIVVSKSDKLRGKVDISGSKNAALPIMAACLAVSGNSELCNIPQLSDVANMTDILTGLGCRIDMYDHTMHINSDSVNCLSSCSELAGKLRASFLVCGPLLARFGKACIALPGGCCIGSRPVDLHIKGFALMGAHVEYGRGYIELSAAKLTGADIYLDFPSVGATENLLIAATLAEGTTVITNAATEPEIGDLAEFLTKCGAKISGIGTEQLTVTGVDTLHGCQYAVMYDRIEAGTFMIASAITGGDVTICGVDCGTLSPVMSKLREMGVEITDKYNECSDCIRVVGRELKSVNIKTMPHPGFPTDMQAQFCALMCCAKGTGIITETIFENRFMHVGELLRMHADISIDGRNAIVCGNKGLIGCKVCSSDLRAGAALVLAGLAASGVTFVDNGHYIDRGYEKFTEKLQSIGADIYVV